MFIVANNPPDAFKQAFDFVLDHGETNEDTLRLTGVLIIVRNPLDYGDGWPAWRKWSMKYVEREWAWYEEATRDPSMVEEMASIWTKMKDKNGEVNSNYGWQVKRNNQWRKCVDGIANSIITGKGTRKHVLTIYDGKEMAMYEHDTPCTISMTFVIRRGTSLNFHLDLHTHMRSNDIWYGLCNDLPAFALFQAKMANEVLRKLFEIYEQKPTPFRVHCGRLLHFVDDLHLYNNFLNKKPEQ